VRCSMVQCVAVRVAALCRSHPWADQSEKYVLLQYVAVSCSVVQCVAVCCSVLCVLQCVLRCVLQ